MFGSGVPEVAAEGLFRGAELLEKQAKGEVPLRSPKTTPAPKTAPGVEKPAPAAAENAGAAAGAKPAGAPAKKTK